MGDVIDFRSRIKPKATQDAQENQDRGAAVVDITDMRNEAVNEDRRQVRRTILTEFISVHTVVPGMGLMRVALFNINENGLAFDIDFKKGHFQVSEEVAMRVYLNHQTYFTFIVRVRHITDVQDEEVHRHGCEFVKGTMNDVALHHFVKFIEHVSASLKHDKGDIVVSSINS